MGALPGGSVRADAAAIAADLAELRHRIHREPEIGLHLPQTQQQVLGALDGLPLEVSLGSALSSVTAVLRGAQPGPTVLLRGDMDALPITERTGLAYTSAVTGVMHACGHDLHTAMLAGAARILSARRRDLAGNVIFMFQPGEEGHAGARHMINEGVLDAAGGRPVAAYALHVASAQLGHGLFATRAGSMMAAADVLDVTVRGHGGHASQPHLSADPIPAACEMVTALQALVTRRFDVFDPVVITVGSFHAGTTDNVIPDEAHFLATVRSFSRAARDRVRAASVRLVTEIAGAHGLQASAEYLDEYPVTVNDAAEAAFAGQQAAALFGAGRVLAQPNPLPGAEDFSFVLEQVPGAFVMLGATPAGADPATAPFNHAADAVFDDSVLADGTTLLAELALRRLAAEEPAG
ncbi:MAG TPA: M20 family metallopeptidase [Streptosporangiaceae bacterium]|nr:M20 family metallopeptidase [Streptosporangiaceae bacterium]